MGIDRRFLWQTKYRIGKAETYNVLEAEGEYVY
jgi:hypothetical protein